MVALHRQYPNWQAWFLPWEHVKNFGQGITLGDHPQTRWRTLLVTTLPSASNVGHATSRDLPTSLQVSPKGGWLQPAFALSHVDRDGRAISSLG
jgi:hypothetical protein